MEKLNNKETTVQEAQAQANLAKQVNNILNYELKRAEVQIKLLECNSQHNSDLKLREVEAKNFEELV